MVCMCGTSHRHGSLYRRLHVFFSPPFIHSTGSALCLRIMRVIGTWARTVYGEDQQFRYVDLRYSLTNPRAVRRVVASRVAFYPLLPGRDAHLTPSSPTEPSRLREMDQWTRMSVDPHSRPRDAAVVQSLLVGRHVGRALLPVLAFEAQSDLRRSHGSDGMLDRIDIRCVLCRACFDTHKLTKDTTRHALQLTRDTLSLAQHQFNVRVQDPGAPPKKGPWTSVPSTTSPLLSHIGDTAAESLVRDLHGGETGDGQSAPQQLSAHTLSVTGMFMSLDKADRRAVEVTVQVPLNASRESGPAGNVIVLINNVRDSDVCVALPTRPLDLLFRAAYARYGRTEFIEKTFISLESCADVMLQWFGAAGFGHDADTTSEVLNTSSSELPIATDSFDKPEKRRLRSVTRFWSQKATRLTQMARLLAAALCEHLTLRDHAGASDTFDEFCAALPNADAPEAARLLQVNVTWSAQLAVPAQTTGGADRRGHNHPLTHWSRTCTLRSQPSTGFLRALHSRSEIAASDVVVRYDDPHQRRDPVIIEPSWLTCAPEAKRLATHRRFCFTSVSMDERLYWSSDHGYVTQLPDQTVKGTDATSDRGATQRVGVVLNEESAFGRVDDDDEAGHGSLIAHLSSLTRTAVDSLDAWTAAVANPSTCRALPLMRAAATTTAPAVMVLHPLSDDALDHQWPVLHKTACFLGGGWGGHLQRIPPAGEPLPTGSNADLVTDARRRKQYLLRPVSQTTTWHNTLSVKRIVYPWGGASPAASLPASLWYLWGDYHSLLSLARVAQSSGAVGQSWRCRWRHPGPVCCPGLSATMWPHLAGSAAAVATGRCLSPTAYDTVVHFLDARESSLKAAVAPICRLLLPVLRQLAVAAIDQEHLAPVLEMHVGIASQHAPSQSHSQAVDFETTFVPLVLHRSDAAGVNGDRAGRCGGVLMWLEDEVGTMQTPRLELTFSAATSKENISAKDKVRIILEYDTYNPNGNVASSPPLRRVMCIPVDSNQDLLSHVTVPRPHANFDYRITATLQSRFDLSQVQGVVGTEDALDEAAEWINEASCVSGLGDVLLHPKSLGGLRTELRRWPSTVPSAVIAATVCRALSSLVVMNLIELIEVRRSNHVTWGPADVRRVVAERVCRLESGDPSRKQADMAFLGCSAADVATAVAVLVRRRVEDQWTTEDNGSPRATSFFLHVPQFAMMTNGDNSERDGGRHSSNCFAGAIDRGGRALLALIAFGDAVDPPALLVDDSVASLATTARSDDALVQLRLSGGTTSSSYFVVPPVAVVSALRQSLRASDASSALNLTIQPADIMRQLWLDATRGDAATGSPADAPPAGAVVSVVLCVGNQADAQDFSEATTTHWRATFSLVNGQPQLRWVSPLKRAPHHGLAAVFLTEGAAPTLSPMAGMAVPPDALPASSTATISIAKLPAGPYSLRVQVGVNDDDDKDGAASMEGRLSGTLAASVSCRRFAMMSAGSEAVPWSVVAEASHVAREFMTLCRTYTPPSQQVDRYGESSWVRIPVAAGGDGITTAGLIAHVKLFREHSHQGPAVAAQLQVLSAAATLGGSAWRFTRFADMSAVVLQIRGRRTSSRAADIPNQFNAQLLRAAGLGQPQRSRDPVACSPSPLLPLSNLLALSSETTAPCSDDFSHPTGGAATLDVSRSESFAASFAQLQYRLFIEEGLTSRVGVFGIEDLCPTVSGVQAPTSSDVVPSETFTAQWFRAAVPTHSLSHRVPIHPGDTPVSIQRSVCWFGPSSTAAIYLQLHRPVKVMNRDSTVNVQFAHPVTLISNLENPATAKEVTRCFGDYTEVGDLPAAAACHSAAGPRPPISSWALSAALGLAGDSGEITIPLDCTKSPLDKRQVSYGLIADVVQPSGPRTVEDPSQRGGDAQARMLLLPFLLHHPGSPPSRRVDPAWSVRVAPHFPSSTQPLWTFATPHQPAASLSTTERADRSRLVPIGFARWHALERAAHIAAATVTATVGSWPLPTLHPLEASTAPTKWPLQVGGFPMFHRNRLAAIGVFNHQVVVAEHPIQGVMTAPGELGSRQALHPHDSPFPSPLSSSLPRQLVNVPYLLARHAWRLVVFHPPRR